MSFQLTPVRNAKSGDVTHFRLEADELTDGDMEQIRALISVYQGKASTERARKRMATPGSKRTKAKTAPRKIERPAAAANEINR